MPSFKNLKYLLHHDCVPLLELHHRLLHPEPDHLPAGVKEVHDGGGAGPDVSDLVPGWML